MLLFSICLLFSCKDQKKVKDEISSEEKKTVKQYHDLDKLNWLIGNWNGIETDVETHENWSKLNDSTLALNGFTLAAKDTVFWEKAVLQQQEAETYFTVTNMLNREEPVVPFRLSSCENGIAIFENPQNEFPQKIIYHRPKNDTLYARIEGTLEGEFQQVDFYFTK